jgi:DinB superfamily
MSFETGEPRSGSDLSQILTALVAQGAGFLAPMPDAVFFAPQGSAWSPAEHIRHLRKSSAPLVTALKLPRLLLRMRFGGHRGPSRSFSEIRELYRGRLSAGATAGRFAPAREGPAPDPADRRREIMNAWTAVTVELTAIMAGWSEPALDRHQLPHPILGILTVREMLGFTVYHTAHHLRRIEERAPGGA